MTGSSWFDGHRIVIQQPLISSRVKNKWFGILDDSHVRPTSDERGDVFEQQAESIFEFSYFARRALIKFQVSRMPRALIREFSVVGFTPSNAAAPFGP